MRYVKILCCILEFILILTALLLIYAMLIDCQCLWSAHLGSVCGFLIICVSLRCFTAKLEDPGVDLTYICNLELQQN